MVTICYDPSAALEHSSNVDNLPIGDWWFWGKSNFVKCWKLNCKRKEPKSSISCIVSLFPCTSWNAHSMDGCCSNAFSSSFSCLFPEMIKCKAAEQHSASVFEICSTLLLMSFSPANVVSFTLKDFRKLEWRFLFQSKLWTQLIFFFFQGIVFYCYQENGANCHNLLMLPIF